MRYLAIVVTLLTALFIEWTFGFSLSFFNIAPPLFTATIIFWFGRVNSTERLLWSFIGGTVKDVFSPSNFGTYILLFLLVALLTEILQIIFSDTTSPLAKGTSMLISLFTSLLLLEIFLLLVNRAGWDTTLLFWSEINLVAAFALWALIFTFVVFSVEHLLYAKT